jgi:hypothetical protein
MLGGSDIFKIEFKGLRELLRFSKTAPRQFAQATQSMINDLGFMVRRSIIAELHKRVRVRSESFMSRQVRVEKSNTNNVNRMAAFIGTLRAKNFDGWSSLEFGKPPQKNRFATILARGGNIESKVKRPFWINQDFPTSDDARNASGGGPMNRIAFLIADMKKNAPAKPFLIKSTGGTNWSPQIAMIKGLKTLPSGKVVPKVVTAQQLNKKPKGKHRPFMRDAYENVLRNVNLQVMWTNALKKAGLK